MEEAYKCCHHGVQGLNGLSVKDIRQVWGKMLVAGTLDSKVSDESRPTPSHLPSSSPNGHDGPQDSLQQGQEIEADGQEEAQAASMWLILLRPERLRQLILMKGLELPPLEEETLVPTNPPTAMAAA